VLVYQMGKVGSSTLVSSLRAIHPPLAVFHVHYLQPAEIARMELRYRRAFRQRRSVPTHMLETRYVRSLLDRRILPAPAGRWRLVIPFREPVARNLSAFFQTLHTTVPALDLERELAQVGLDALLPRLAALFRETLDHTLPIRWFDLEPREIFGLDLPALPFDREQSWALHSNERAEAVVVKLERLRACAGPALQALLGVDGVRLLPANEAREKAYYPIYSAFREWIRLPEEYVERLYAARWVQAWYTPAELDAFRTRWLGRQA
jgi:hypothetical protein